MKAAKRPHRLSITLEPAFGLPTTYTFENGSLHVNFRGHLARSSTPTLQQWSGFWRLCGFLEIDRWLPAYDDRMCRDGYNWSMTIAKTKNDRITSRGSNGYPSLEDPTNCSSTMDRFALLLHFIDLTLLTASPDITTDFAEYPHDG